MPEVVARPETLSKNPKYKSTGVNWDSRIFVQFDKDMDPNSIYYTEPEYEAKKVELGITEEIDSSDIDPDNLDEHDNVFLCVDKNENPKRYYGYIKDGETVFKNIQITNYSNTSENLLKYFKAPRFEDSKRLSISPITKKVNDKNQPVLGSGKTIFVTLDKNFYYSASIGENNSKPVTMRKPVSWNYLLNGTLDGTGPIVSTVSIKDMNGNYVPTSSSSDPCYLNNSKKLKFYISVQDDDSGPASEFKMLLKKTGYTEVKTIPIKYENADGNYATSGNSEHYYECVIDDIPSDVDGDYEFNLQFYDNSENYYTGEESTKTYYVSIDSFPPVVQNKKISTCDDSNNSNKTAVKLEYTTADARFVGGDVWYRRAIPTSDANWDNWTQSTKDILDKEETSKVIEGLDFGTTYEFKTVYYDEAGNATKPYYFKRTTKPQGYDSSWVTVNTYEDSRCIKISTTKKPAGAQTTKLIYTTGVFGINEETITYNTATTNDFFIRNIDYAKTYKIKLVTENSEKIDDHRYENYSSSYIWNDKCETELSAQKTKPQGVTVTAGEPEFVLNNKFRYKFTVKGKKTNLTGVKYKYGYYRNGSLIYPTSSDYSGKITPTDNSSEFTLNEEFVLTSSTRYHFIFESYYDTEDNVCDPIVKKEFDFWTPPVEVNQDTFKCETQTMTTAKLTWQKPDGDFSHYKIVWYKSSDANTNNKFEAYVPKDETSFTITNLLSNTYYKASIFCYSYKNECCGQENSDDYISFQTKNTVSDELFRINKIRIDTNSNNNNINIYIKYSSSFVGFSGSFKKVTVKWVEQQSSSESYETLLYRLKSTNNKDTFSSPTSYVTMNISNSNKTYYLRFFDPTNNEPVSDVFAVRPKFSVSTNMVYYLQEFSYDIQSEDIILLHIKWNDNIYSNPITKIRWKKTGETQANWKSMSFSYNQQSSTVYIYDSFTPGSTFDVEFCNDNGNVVYAAAFITIPSIQKNAFASNLTASKWSYDSITLTWDQNADCDYYNVYKEDISDSVLVADQINKASPSVTIRGLTSNTYYSFIVVCHKRGIEDTITSGDWTNSHTKSIWQNTNDKKIYINSVIQSDGDSTNIYLKFNDVQQSKGVKVYYKAEDETDWNSTTVGNGNYTPLSTRINNLTSGTKYEIKAVALSNEINNVVQESFPATCVAYTRPDKPSINPSFTITSSSIRVSWSFPFSGKWSKALLSYSKTTSDSDFIPLKIIDYEDRNNFDSRYYELKNLESGTTYYFKLTCYIDEAMTLGTDSYRNGAKTYSQ